MNVLLTWELGADLGHIARLRPVARELLTRGHAVTIAARNLQKIGVLPASLDVIPAPGIFTQKVKDPIREPATFADILYNAGVAQSGMLSGLVRAWHGIFKLVKPDVVVMDYSPIALLALQGTGIRSMLFGTGFACPPPVHPLPDIRAWQNHYPDRVRATEAQVLQALNLQLAEQGQAALGGIGELFTRADGNFLATFPELDHYPQRQHVKSSSYEYCGVWSELDGAAPQWPGVPGKRIYAYLKPFRGLPRVLDHLLESGHPTLVFLPGEVDASRWQSASMRVVGQPLDMFRIARESDLALLHAGHGTTTAMLLGGTPIVQLPIVVEQYHTALNTERMGAGVQVGIDDPERICKTIDEALANPGLAEAARRFALDKADFNPRQELDRLVGWIG